MKNNKIIYTLLASIVLIFSACDPIVDEEKLTDSTDVAGVEITAIQTPPGGNKVTLKMSSPGITGYWNYNLGKALTNEVTIVHPIPGKNTFKYIGSLGSQFFTKTIDVQIDRLDTPLQQDWYDLVSKNTSAGKTWVFDGVANDDKLWWFMSAPDNPDNAMTAWWNAGGTCCAPPDTGGKMHFDLNGAANYSYFQNDMANPTKGSFDLDIPNKKLTLIKAPILGQDRGNPEGVYTIITLTEEKLVLYLAKTPQGDSGWTWVFKPQ